MNASIARSLLYRPATWVRGEPVFSLLRHYEQSQWWPPESLEQLQKQQLSHILRHAVTRTVHYREVARGAGIDPRSLSFDDLSFFPLLSKRDLVERGDRLRAARIPGSTSWKTTGGSTGVAVRLRKNRAATAAEQAASWRSYAWYGIRPGDRQARFWGVPLTSRARWRFRAIDLVLNRDRFSAFAFGEKDLRSYYERMLRTRPVWAYGYVSMLAQFALFCRNHDLPLGEIGLRAVVTTSEVLTPANRTLIAEVFGAPVFDEYGCGEVGPILYECTRGRLHLMAENLYVELPADPTPDEPDARRLVLTDLHNRATPLIRYDVGDRVVPAQPCICGRGLPAFERVFGRAYDFIRARDGTGFHAEFFLYILEHARDRGLPVQQVQFVQKAPDLIELRIVPSEGYTLETGRTIAQEIVARSGGRFQARAVEVSEIPRERSGKIRLIRAL